MSDITATHPAQIEPTFSSRQDERDTGQFLRVTAFYPDGSHDFEEARLADVGVWCPVEEISECQERLERTLRRRHQARLDEAKIRSDQDDGIFR